MKWLNRFFSHVAIAFDGRRAICRKGKITASVLREVTDILIEADLETGEIWVSAEPKLSFSREIGPEIQQQLRNVIIPAIT